MTRRWLLLNLVALPAAITAEKPPRPSPGEPASIVYTFHGTVPQRAKDEGDLIHWLHLDLKAQSEGRLDTEARRHIEKLTGNIMKEW